MFYRIDAGAINRGLAQILYREQYQQGLETYKEDSEDKHWEGERNHGEH